MLSSLCVSRSKQSLITGHSGEQWGVCAGVCVRTEASLLNTGSGGIPGPRRWLLKPDLKEFGKCARGHITGSEQEKEGKDLFCLSFVAPWRIQLGWQSRREGLAT